jgi:biopolymer transport protein ExbB
MFYPKRLAVFFAAALMSSGLFAADQAAGADQEQAAQTQQAPPGPAVTVEMLQRAIAAQRDAEAQANRTREQRFTEERNERRNQLNQAVRDRNAAEARSNALDQQYADNELRIEEISNQLQVNQGNLGELFGVTRQVSGDVAGMLGESLTNTEIVLAPGEEGRVDLMRRLAAAVALPDIGDLEGLWLSILDELRMGGEVTTYQAPVQIITTDAESNLVTNVEQRDVVRVASFMAFSDGDYLGYLPQDNQLFKLERQPSPEFVRTARNLQAANPSEGYQMSVVDPSRGALLGLYVQRPDVIERIENGEVVGWVIVFVAILGIILAAIQYLYLFITSAKMRSQMRNLDNPKASNPLGRLLLSAAGKGNETAEVVELRISDSVLREMPRLERFQSFLRLAVAAGPLLGLIGTVIGMIVTFESITASGSSDPKLMAHGIGQAMIATVLGLSAAIPLLFLNTGLAAISRGLLNTLEEQGTNLLARKLAEIEHQGAGSKA